MSAVADSIGIQIKTIRTNRGLSQRALATRIGTHQPSIARIEEGTNLPSLRFLRLVSEALDADLKVEIVERGQD